MQLEREASRLAQCKLKSDTAVSRDKGKNRGESELYIYLLRVLSMGREGTGCDGMGLFQDTGPHVLPHLFKAPPSPLWFYPELSIPETVRLLGDRIHGIKV